MKFIQLLIICSSVLLIGCTNKSLSLLDQSIIETGSQQLTGNIGSSELQDDIGSIEQVCTESNCFRVEIADTLEKRRVGLMMRKELATDAGMLFIFDEMAPNRKFRMKNTLIPLDMIWMDADGKVVYIEPQVPPCIADPCPSYGPTTEQTKYVLEVYSGVASTHQIAVGSEIDFIFAE